MRDDFSSKTKEMLAKRVAYRCSNPDCRKPTIGPHSHPMKAVNIGVASHITAAAPNGPRFDPSLSKEERQFIENGIWLCSNCAAMIDKDEGMFPIELLKNWKQQAEQEATDAIQFTFKETTSTTTTTTITTRSPDHVDPRPFAEADMQLDHRFKRNNGLSPKNKAVFGDNPVFIGNAIYIYHLGWMYTLKVYNNSTAHLFNLKMKIINAPKELNHVDDLSAVKHILPLGDVDINLSFGSFCEMTGKEASQILEEKFPAGFDDLELLLQYEDGNRKGYETSVTFKNGELVNKHL